ncbi:hypothetical protein J6A64_00165 [bacterium]|nr:hypothetical protein [bacterium]
MKKNIMIDQIYKYGKDITWSVPVAFQYEVVWGALFHNFQDYCINLPQVNGYGCPISLWTGGRAPAIKDKMGRPLLLRIFNYLRSIKVTPSFTFTCTQLTEDDFNDPYANYLLDMALDADSHFIVYDDRLKDYIKNKKSDAYVVASVIKPAFQFQGDTKVEEATAEKESEFYNKLLKEYDLVVVRPEYSSTVLLEHPEYIDDISRVEVLINQPCIPNCPRMPGHYKHMENFRNEVKDFKKFGRYECARERLSPEETLGNTLCHDEATVHKLVENGVKHLKVQGRGVGIPPQVLMYQLYALMFRTDGAFNLPYVSLSQTKRLDREIQEFKENILRIRTINNQQPKQK